MAVIAELPDSIIKLVVYDFDGVMTNNKVFVFEDGKEAVLVNRADGLGVNLIRAKGVKQIILSTETNTVVTVRANKLGIDVIQGCENKEKALQEYCITNAIDLAQVVYIGNDINDLQAMKIVGYPMCPADSSQEIRNISCKILSTKGGDGVARELATLFR